MVTKFLLNYIIFILVPLLSHNVKKCAPLTKDIIDEKTTKLMYLIF